MRGILLRNKLNKVRGFVGNNLKTKEASQYTYSAATKIVVIDNSDRRAIE
jgi:hypothetical protein